MTTSAQQIRTYEGPALLSYGFRVFFLAGAAWAALTVALWLPVLTGALTLPAALSPIDWHVHELLFGFLPAIVAGFLLTAVPNWTGRLPVMGAPLLALFLVWAAGRIAVLISQHTGILTAAAVDLAFLVTLGAVIAREIIAGRNYRNLRVLVLVGLLLAANAAFWIEAATASGDGYGTRLGIAAAVLLISLIGGRIIPSFTHNWLARRASGRMPVTFNRFDIATLLATAIALAGWVAAPHAAASAGLLTLAGLMHLARLLRWAGERTIHEPIVLILHVGYAFIPLGFFLVAASILTPHVITTGGALHAWTAGAIGTMTLAVMTRASLGHTGRTTVASRTTQAIYVLVIAAALFRLGAALGIAYMPMLQLSAAAWVLAFGGFAFYYGRMLVRPRVRPD
jgi:uncharacterized protein involved in response to NO